MHKEIPSSFYTDRLKLRGVTESDWKEVLFLKSDEGVNKYIYRPEEARIKDKSDALRFIEKIQKAVDQNLSYFWGIQLGRDTQMAGSICLWNFSPDRKTAEVGYDLHPDFQGRGLMSEALKVVITLGFEMLELGTIEAFTHRENTSSRRLLEKMGFCPDYERKDPDNDFNVGYFINKPSMAT